MYLPFFELKEKPFNTAPDPKFLYLTPGHREAFSQLIYGVRERRGFIVLTGGIGTGKTTLLQALMQRLDGEAEIAFIPFSMLSFDEILTYLLTILGSPETSNSRAQRLQTLKRLLTDRHRAGKNVVLIIDEAQLLDPTTLEQVRLLSNFETSTEKLFQIILVGHPELNGKLELPELRQLDQRIGLRCSLRPLTPAESRELIRHRLRIAGAKDVYLFTEKAEARIAKFTHGIPRLLNILCDHCLLFGYADQKRKIDHKTVEHAIAYLEKGKGQELLKPTRSVGGARRRFHRALIMMAAVVVGGVTVSFLPSQQLAGLLRSVEGHLGSVAMFARDMLSPLVENLRGRLSG